MPYRPRVFNSVRCHGQLRQRLVKIAPNAIDELPCPVMVAVWRMFILDATNARTGFFVEEQPRRCAIAPDLQSILHEPMIHVA